MMLRAAEISECGRYRYSLSRVWSAAPPALFVMLNPSTADAEADDPTIRRCVSFAQGWGNGGICVVNLFAFRSPSPAELRAAYKRHEMDDVKTNLEAVRRQARLCARAVVAWGASGNRYAARVLLVLEALRVASPASPECLGRTADGHPRHPLYVKRSTPLEPYAVSL